MSSEALQRTELATGKRRLTYQDLLAELPETNQPSELWDGELVMSPAPSFYHQEIVLRFYRALYEWVTTHRLGKVISSPVDMVLSPHRTTQPDVAYIAQERLNIVERSIMGSADLVAEVVSLEGRNRDRIEKRDLYEQHGVKEYWIIDPEPETVEVLCLEGASYRVVERCRRGETAASRLLSGFHVSVDVLLAN